LTDPWSSGCEPGAISKGNAWKHRYVKKLSDRTGTALPLLKCLRTPKSTKSHDFAYTISNFFGGGGGETPDPAESPPVLGPRHQFPLGSPAFPLFLFYETTTVANVTRRSPRSAISPHIVTVPGASHEMCGGWREAHRNGTDAGPRVRGGPQPWWATSASLRTVVLRRVLTDCRLTESGV